MEQDGTDLIPQPSAYDDEISVNDLSETIDRALAYKGTPAR